MCVLEKLALFLSQPMTTREVLLKALCHAIVGSTDRSTLAISTQIPAKGAGPAAADAAAQAHPADAGDGTASTSTLSLSGVGQDDQHQHIQGNMKMEDMDIHAPNAGDNLSESLTVEVSGRFSAYLSEDSESGKGYSERGRYVFCLPCPPNGGMARVFDGAGS